MTSSKTFAGTYPGQYTLSAPDTTITNTGTVINTGTNGYAVYGNFGTATSTLTNFGSIAAPNGVAVYSVNVATVVNAGYIMGNLSNGNGKGIYLKAGGSVTNQLSGTITARDAIYAYSSATVVNAGNIVGNLSDLVSRGIYLKAGGSVANQSTGTITGDQAIYANSSATVVNTGSIIGNTGLGDVGIVLAADGSVTNQSGGLISGYYGIHATESVSVVNAGSISGGMHSSGLYGSGIDIFGIGVQLHGGGAVTNLAGGAITGYVGVFAGAAATVVNAGSIGGSTDAGGAAVLFTSGNANRLVVDPGAVFTGTVDGGNTIGATVASTLELASGAGTLTGLGSQFINFGSIVFDPGSDWLVAGNAAGLAGTISGFAQGDTIEITGITATGLSYAAGVLTLAEASGSVTLHLPGSVPAADFTVTNVAGGAEVTIQPAPVPPGEVVLSGASAQYAIANDGGSLYIQDTVAGRDGTQVLSGIDVMQFTDGVGLFDPTGNAEDIARLYPASLNRAPDVSGLQFWTAEMDNSHVSLISVANDFAASPEFIQDYGALSDAAYVNQLYENVLGRSADAAGATYWDGVLASGASRGAVLVGFAESQENEAATISTAGNPDNAEVYRLYEATLGRAPDAGGQAFWSTELANGGTPTQVAQSLVSSPEFQQTYGNLAASDFVSTLYQNVLHRAADSGGLQYWTNALQSGTSEGSVVIGFADSIENRAATAGPTHVNWVFIPA